MWGAKGRCMGGQRVSWAGGPGCPGSEDSDSAVGVVLGDLAGIS